MSIEVTYICDCCGATDTRASPDNFQEGYPKSWGRIFFPREDTARVICATCVGVFKGAFPKNSVAEEETQLNKQMEYRRRYEEQLADECPDEEPLTSDQVYNSPPNPSSEGSNS